MRQAGRFCTWATAAAWALAWPSVSRAQMPGQNDTSAISPNNPVVTMPVLKKDPGAAYPKRALDEGYREPGQVALELTVDAEGKVTKATVLTPAGHGFDEAAVEAARGLEFDAATRDGRPVAARIKFLYRFAPPPAVLSGKVVRLLGDRPIEGAKVVVRDGSGQERTATTGPDGAWRVDKLAGGTYHVTITAPGMTPREADQAVAPGEEASALDRLAAPAAPPPPEAPDAGPPEVVDEVQVRGEKPPREVVKRTLDQRELERIPGTNGDALRSLQNLPGVARTPPLSGALIVRGSAPEDSQYFVDGTPVPIVYHFGGLSAVVPTEMIGKLDFYPGNFSAQYGRGMGGVVDVGLSEPQGDRLHAMAQADFIDTRAVVQGPLFDTGWKFAVSGRRSYFDLWLAPVLSSAGAGVTAAPVYYDYQAVLERDLDKHSKLRFAFFGSDDKIDLLLQSASSSAPTLAGNLGFHDGFWRGQARYVNTLTKDTELRVVGAVGQDYISFSAGSIYFNLTDWPISSRIELAQKIDRLLTINVGTDLVYVPYDVSAQLPPLPKPGQPPPGPFGSAPPITTSSSSYAFQPAFYVEGESTPWKGGRLVPGLRVDYNKDTDTWDLAPRLNARQDVTNDPRTTIKGAVGLYAQPPQIQETNAVFGMKGLTSNRSLQYDLGVEREVTEHVDASLDGFYKKFDNLVELGYGNTGSGQAYGLEVLLRYKADERFFGWVAYTLSRSERQLYPGAPVELFEYDETHVLTILGSYRLGRGWEFGMRYRLASGFLTTPSTYGFFDENIGTYLPLSSYPTYGSRLPLFHSLDVRVDKTWMFPWGKLAAYLDILNIYDQGNVDGVTYDYNYTHTAYVNDLPIIPSLGLRVEH